MLSDHELQRKGETVIPKSVALYYLLLEGKLTTFQQKATHQEYMGPGGGGAHL